MPRARLLSLAERDLARKIMQNARIRIGDPHDEHRTDRVHIGTGSADH